MCGICGFLGDPTGINRAAMLDALKHRGPDGEGVWEDRLPEGVIWLGHRRLSVLDLSPAGHQPMSAADNQLVITFNGEIYNFRELRAELEGYGYTFRSNSDTEVLLYAWHRWGVGALDRLCGMFAFALWDRRNHSLWLARDRMGEKPLYYTVQNGRFLFASEVRSLLASGVVERRMDSDGLDAYLTFGSVADPFTLIKDVRAVEAGHWLRLHKGQIVARAYWSLRDIPEERVPVTRGEALETVGMLLRQSCSFCMVSDVPVAVLLSGGIDSSSNVAILSEQGFCNLQTFSVIFKGFDETFSEERWSSLVAGQFQTCHHQIEVGENEAHSWVPEAVQAMDQPSFDGVNTYLVCRAIRSAGIKVAISGQGADELFLGYWQKTLFPWLLFLASLPISWLRYLLSTLAAHWARLHDTKYEKLFQTLGAHEPLAAAYLAQHSVFSQRGLERLRGEKRLPQTRFIRDQGGTTPLGKLSRLELTHYLRNTLLRDGDQMSMANSIELRSSFVNHRLVEKIVALPTHLKVNPHHRQKPLLVDAVGSSIVNKVAQRPKQGFALPYDRWLRNGLRVADLTEVDLGLDHEAIRTVEQRFTSGQNWSRFWTLQVLAAWVEKENISPPKP